MCPVNISNDRPCYLGNAGPDECEYGVEVKERPVSRKRARKLRKRHGVSVYFSKRLECLVWVKTA